MEPPKKKSTEIVKDIRKPPPVADLSAGIDFILPDQIIDKIWRE
jgi:hypothetical protein